MVISLLKRCWFNKNGDQSSEASSSQGCVSSISDDGEILYSGATAGSKGNPTEYSTLHVVGCSVYVVYNFQERTKLDPKSMKCIFLGYVDGVKGYRLWDPTSHKVIVSGDVIFAENELQREKENDNISKDITTVHIDGKSVEDDSFEAEPEHGVQELEEPNGVEV
ncbi:hypothetical protein KIW84_060784 [Lathyrus oleraceus]|uniref:Retroviral polymerase SH3-like domain-containing protein n=1 Tax=Pisum sativum TaxID=3888 RepID=A0A9D5A4B8_PEA|nr:hypothetical protein KIW84_060784 [Pisum sativum]